MDIERTEIILTSKLPSQSVPWDGKLMAVRNGSVLYVPVAFYREGQELPLHKRILKEAGLGRVGRHSRENFGGCYMKMFMGIVALKGSSGDFGPVKEQAALCSYITSALRKFFHRENIAIHEIDTGGLDA